LDDTCKFVRLTLRNLHRSEEQCARLTYEELVMLRDCFNDLLMPIS